MILVRPLLHRSLTHIKLSVPQIFYLGFSIHAKDLIEFTFINHIKYELGHE